MRLFFVATALIMTLTTTGTARAGSTVRSGTSGYEKIGKGVFDLAVDNLVLVHYHSQPGADESSSSSLYASYIAGATVRRFISDNFSLGLSVNWGYQRSAETVEAAGATQESVVTDSGLLGFLIANYYVRLGNGLFLKPGIGVGGLWGTRSVPGTANTVVTSDLIGGAARLDLGFVYYATPHFNLKAGMDVIMRAGNETTEGAPEGPTFVSHDVGIRAGLGYSF